MNKRSRDPNGDERYTLKETFEKCQEIAGVKFDWDICASKQNALCKKYFTKENSALHFLWIGNWFCNPPWSEIGPFVERAWWSFFSLRSSESGTGTMLLPDNRQGTEWWQRLIEPARDGRDDKERARPMRLTTHYLPGRPKYGKPTDPLGLKQDSPPFGSVVLCWRKWI